MSIRKALAAMNDKHCVSMSIDRVEIVEVHDDYVVVIEYLKPDPKGPFLVMSDHAEPEWATRKFKEPRSLDSALEQTTRNQQWRR